jgi:hypothetical protein
MKPKSHGRGILAVSVAASVLSSVALSYPIGNAFSQQPPVTDKAMPDHGHTPGNMPHSHPKMMQQHGQMAGMTDATTPSLPGQDAFGAVQEIVRILEADPKTDWSKVNLESLRQHLIDMNDVTLKADAVAKPIDGGIEIAVTGSDRTVAAIQRMVPAWAMTMNGYKGWTTKVAPLPNGDLLTVTTADAKEVPHIRGLGFIGLMASGSHHQIHHLAMAKGEFAHQH